MFGKYERKARLVAFKCAWSPERNGFIREEATDILELARRPGPGTNALLAGSAVFRRWKRSVSDLRSTYGRTLSKLRCNLSRMETTGHSRWSDICEYTGVLLDENDPNSPWYVSIDHRFPGRKGNLAVRARFVNSLKANLTTKQFPRVMNALARMMDGEPFDESVIPD